MIAAGSGLGCGGEQVADMVEDPGVGGGVGAGGAADRRLVDVDHLVEPLHADQPAVSSRQVAGAVQPVVQRLGEDVVDQRRLPAPGDSGDRHQHPQWELDVHPLEVVLRGTDHGQRAADPDAARRWRRDGAPTRQVVAGDRLRFVDEVIESSLGDDPTTVLPGAGADVDDVVGDADGVLVVLDHDEGVAHVAQPYQRLDQPLVVALVEPDRRLVEDVEHPDQARPDLGGESYPLRLATGQAWWRLGPG